MKSISAAIVIMASAILIVGGAFVSHGDTQMFVMVVGCGVGLAGLWAWFGSLKDK